MSYNSKLCSRASEFTPNSFKKEDLLYPKLWSSTAVFATNPTLDNPANLMSVSVPNLAKNFHCFLHLLLFFWSNLLPYASVLLYNYVWTFLTSLASWKVSGNGTIQWRTAELKKTWPTLRNVRTSLALSDTDKFLPLVPHKNYRTLINENGVSWVFSVEG